MAYPDETTPWYKQFWPWAIMILPAIVVVAGIWTIVIAFKYEDSLVKDNYYKEGLGINRSLRLDERAKEWGVSGQLVIESTLVNLQLAIAQPAFTPIDWPAALQLEFSHPTNDQYDFAVSLTHLGEGRYSAAALALKEHADVSEVQKWYLTLSNDGGEEQRWRLQGQVITEINKPVTLQLQAVAN